MTTSNGNDLIAGTCSGPAIDQDIEEILLTEQQIKAKIAELGRIITQEYQGKDLLVVGILKGAFVFMADLVKEIKLPINLDFMVVSSYGASTKTSGVVRIVKDLDEEIEGRHVLVVEDIIDTGLTLNYLVGILQSRNPASVKTCTLLDKPERRKVPFTPDFNGFSIPDKFVVGYGLDYAERYRNLPYIGIPKARVYEK